MPNWKKVIVSGSNISQLNNDGVYLRNTGDGILSSSAQIATQISGAFTATSASLNSRINNITGTFASTGSNSFKGVQTFSGSLLPEDPAVFGLGSADYIWAELYVDGQSIYMRDVATNTFVTMSANNGILTFNNAGLNVPLGITSSKLILTSVVNAGTDTDKFLVLDSNGNVDFRTGTEVLSDIGGQGSTPGTVSSSAQIQAYNIFLEKLGDNVISSSAQLTPTFDTRYLNTIGDGVISSSAQIASDISGAFLAPSASFSTRVTTLESATANYALKTHITGAFTSLSSSFSSRLTLDETDIDALQVTSSQLVYSLDWSATDPFTIEWDRFDGSNGGFSQNSTLKTIVYNATSSINTLTAASGGFSSRLTTLEAAGGTTFSSSVSSRLTSVEGYTLDNVTDNGSTTTNGITIGGLTVNGNATITGTLTAQQFNTEYVSASVIFQSGSTKFGDTSDDVHSFTGSIKLNTQTAATTDTDKFLVFDTGGQIKYRTGAQVLSDINPGGLISSSAQVNHDATTNFVANEHIDHTSVSISAGNGLSGGGNIAATRTLTLNTASVHFTDGVKKKLNTDGVISSSAQLTGTFDTRYLNTIGDGVISSSAQVTISSTTGYTTFSSSIASDIAALQGAGYVDVGTGAVGLTNLGNASGSRIALWQDGDTIKGVSGVVSYDNFYPAGTFSGQWDGTPQNGIASPTITTDGLYIGGHSSDIYNNGYAGPFTASISMVANTGGTSAVHETVVIGHQLTAVSNYPVFVKEAQAVFVNYFLSNTATGGRRAGTITIVSDGANSAIHTETSTTDMGGSTAAVEFSAGSSSGVITLYVTAPGGCNIQMEAKRMYSI